jgi:urease accessory protein
MSIDGMLRLLQFADGLFPAGAYAHSFGLETYAQSGAADSPAAIESIIRSQLRGSLATCDAIILTHALAASRREDFRACREIDALADAMKPARETREASRQMGRQTLRVAAALTEHPVVAEFAAAASSGATPCHHCVVFGLVGGAYGWSPPDAAAAFLYSSCVAMVNAGIRLLPMGQLDGQRIIARLLPEIATLAAAAAQTPLSDASSSATGLEIAAMRHAALDARLFRS